MNPPLTPCEAEAVSTGLTHAPNPNPDTYELHDAVEEPALSPKTKLDKWIAVYERVYGDYDVGNDAMPYLFPKVDGSQIYPIDKLMKFDLNGICIKAGIVN